jgi:hypothetical protein
MKVSIARLASACAALVLLAAPAASAQLITFDDLPGDGSSISNGYAGLNWSNFGDASGPFAFSIFGPSGYSNGVVSPENVAFNDNGGPATISVAPGSTFALNSGYFTGAWNDGLNVEVVASLLGTTVDEVSFTANTSGPTLETFNFAGIDSVTFISSGGTQNPAFSDFGEQFVLDNLQVNAVPEPTTFALTALGAVAMVVARLRRRKPRPA